MSENPPERSTRTLWLIAALCVAPVVASYLTYYFWQPAGQINYGELLKAPPLPAASVKLADGSAFELAALRGKWVLLMTDSAHCAEACERKLFMLRQLRLAQGKEMERIERAWLITDEGVLADRLTENYRGTYFIRDGEGKLVKGLPDGRPAGESIYLIDPLGNIVLRYPSDADPRKVIKDIARLLKISGIG